jgi:hypothetical protein
MPSTALQVACLAIAQLSQPETLESIKAYQMEPPAGVAAPSTAESFQPFSSSDPAPPARVISDRSTVAPAITYGRTADPSAPGTIRSVNNEVAPASGFRESNATHRGDATARLAEELAAICVTKLQEFPKEALLAGQEMSVLEVLSVGGNRAQAVQAYWELATAVGDYRFALEEAQFLASLPSQAGSFQETLLNAAVAMARARTQEARLHLLSQQEKLNSLMARRSGRLPWPVDKPLVVSYRTRFDTLFSGQSRPMRLEQIDRLLPELQKQIDLRAAAVAATSSAVSQLADRFRRGQSDVTQLFAAHDNLRQQRSGFLDTLLSYNRQIAEYALQVAAAETAPERLVTTLIRVAPKDQQLVPVSPDGIRQATRGRRQ